MKKKLITFQYYVAKSLSATRYLVLLPAAYLLFLYRKFSGKLPETLWLFSERGDEARDNAFHFFNYVNKRMAKDIYFIIDKRSADSRLFENKNHCVKPDSFKHWYLYLSCTHLVGTFLYGGVPGGRLGSFTLPFARRKLYVNLKHGIIKDHRVWNSKYIDLIACASEREVDNFEYKTWQSKESVRLLGLCRFDALVDKSRSFETKLILIMPTFRKWLHKESVVKGATDFILDDEYYKAWNSLLKSEKVHHALIENGAKIVFYPHYRIQPFLEHFYSDDNLVTHGHRDNFDIQDLLINSSLMITDYSSVFFDFAYQYKPVLHWHFDKDRFQKEHYASGSFTFEDDGFGPILYSLDQIESAILESIANTFTMAELYKNRVHDYFIYTDRNNCERTYQHIAKLRPNQRISER